MPRLLALLLVTIFASSLYAGPTADVMKLVPPKTTVCFVVQDLRGTASRLGESPFAAFFAESRLGKGLLAADELKQLALVETILKDHLGVTFAALRDDILGDVVVYAYQPPTDGKADQDSGILLGKTAKPDTLAKLVAKLNVAQTQSKEVKATADKAHNGITYVERQKADGKTEFYLLREDGLFAYTVQESVLKQVIDRLDGTDKAPSPLAGAIDTLGLSKAFAVMLFEPAAFAADLTAQAKQTDDPNQKAFLTQFAQLWSATEAVGVSLTFDKDVTLAVTAAAHPNKVPEELQGLFKSDSKSSSLWSVMPDDALLAIGGRFEWEKFHTTLRSFLSEEGKAGVKQTLDDVLAPLVGKASLPKVLAGLGPDWAIWLTPPAKGDSGVLPNATFVIRVRAAGSNDTTVGKAIVSTFDALLHTFRLGYNRAHADEYTLDDEKADGITIRVLSNDKALPLGVRPAYGLHGDFFVLGSNPETVKRFTPPKPDEVVNDAPLLRLNAVSLAKYLNRHGNELSEVLAGWTGEKPEKAKSDMADFATVLELFDALEIHHSADGKRMSISVKAKTAKPLKK